MNLLTGEKARWTVIWWNRKKKKFSEVEFDTDFKGALELYVKAKAAGKPFATLRCCNVGFPPPEKYRPYNKRVVQKKSVFRGGRKRVKKTIVEVPVVPMEEVNLQGVWWCPYCREFRKFKKQQGAMYDEYVVSDEGMYCPVCQIRHTDYHVRVWNPQAQRLPYKLAQRRTRKTSGSTKRRRTRKR